MNWVQIKPTLLRSECNAFTICRDDRFQPPIFSATKWSKDQLRGWDKPDKPKVTLGKFDSLEAAQKACEAAA
jgi:hypothetical protein